MIASTKKDSLRKAALSPNHDRLEVEDEYFLPDPRVIAHEEFPRHVDIDSRLDNHPRSDPSPKASKKKTFHPAGPR
jgi:hypothetical protein